MNFLVTNAISRRHPRKQGRETSYKTAFLAAAAIGIWAYIEPLGDPDPEHLTNHLGRQTYEQWRSNGDVAPLFMAVLQDADRVGQA